MVRRSVSEQSCRRLMLFILCMACFFRFFLLESQSLWIDEVSQVESARLVGEKGPAVVIFRDNVSPLSHWFLALWIRLFGISEMAIRLPSAVAGILAVIVAFKLGKALFPARLALASAAAVAVSPFAIWYSQDARMYSFVLLESYLILLYFWRAVNNPLKRRWWVLVCALTVIGLYTHQYVALLSISCGLYLLFSRHYRSVQIFWAWLLTQIASACIYLPWLLLVLLRFDSPAGIQKPLPLLWIPYALFGFTFGFSFGPSVRELHRLLTIEGVLSDGLVLIPAISGAAILFATGILALLHRKDLRNETVYCLYAFGVPLLLAAIAPMFSNISFNVRYVAVAYPAFVLIMCGSVLSEKRKWVRNVSAVLLSMGLFYSLHGYYLDARYAKEDIRSAGAYLATQAGSADVIIVVSGSPRKIEEGLRFYGLQTKAKMVLVNRKSLDDTIRDLQRLIDGSDNIWLLECRSWASDPLNTVGAALARIATRDFFTEWPGVRLVCYRQASDAHLH